MTDPLERAAMRIAEEARQIASDARDTAKEALTAVKLHMLHCDRREDQRLQREEREHNESVAHRKEIKEVLEAQSEQLAEVIKGQHGNRESVYRLIIAVLLLLTGGLVSLIAYVLVNGLPWWLPGTGP